MTQTKNQTNVNEKAEMPKVIGARYDILDLIRGLAVVNMALFHFLWDLVYLAGFNWQWFDSGFIYIWQRSICCTFILLSGFCCYFSHHRLKRGITVFLSGILISVVTYIFIPEGRVVFGILTFLGTAIMLTVPLRGFLEHINCYAGFSVSLLLYLLTRSIAYGYIEFMGIHIWNLPEFMYRLGYAGDFFGFAESDFYSADYFPFIPWFFLFICGYFLCGILKKQNLFEKKLFSFKMNNAFTFIGKHSLIIYLLHQPFLYFIVWVIFLL